MAAQLAEGIADLGWDGTEPPDFAALAAKTDVFDAFQNPWELATFLRAVHRLRPRTVVEIGTAGGGLLYCLSQVAHPNATLVSIDFPGGPYGGGQTELECELFANFGAPTQRLHFIRDRSFSYDTLADVRRALRGRPVDLLFIDGDHSYGGVLADFEMYGPLVGPRGLIALHDINVLPHRGWGRGFDVGHFWRRIKGQRQVVEISDLHAPKRPRVGKRWPAYGIGLVLGERLNARDIGL